MEGRSPIKRVRELPDDTEEQEAESRQLKAYVEHLQIAVKDASNCDQFDLAEELETKRKNAEAVAKEVTKVMTEIKDLEMHMRRAADEKRFADAKRMQLEKRQKSDWVDEVFSSVLNGVKPELEMFQDQMQVFGVRVSLTPRDNRMKNRVALNINRAFKVTDEMLNGARVFVGVGDSSYSLWKDGAGRWTIGKTNAKGKDADVAGIAHVTNGESPLSKSADWKILIAKRCGRNDAKWQTVGSKSILKENKVFAHQFFECELPKQVIVPKHMFTHSCLFIFIVPQ